MQEALYFYNTDSDQIQWHGDLQKASGYFQEELKKGGRPFYIKKIPKIDREKYLKAIKSTEIKRVIEMDYRLKTASG